MTQSTNSPRNTSSDDLMVKMLVGLSADGIEEQERQGQRELLNATTLPTDLNNSEREDFEALGFVFGDTVPGDRLFQQVSLPDGWKREGSEHAMWSYIVDERGVRRVRVFYKAAFYDRRAFMDIDNVGWSIAGGHIYGDGAVEFTPRADLTDEERADALASARSYIADAKRAPDIYADRLPRAQAVVDALA